MFADLESDVIRTPRDPAHIRRIGRFLDEFEWYAKALKRARAEGVPY